MKVVTRTGSGLGAGGWRLVRAVLAASTMAVVFGSGALAGGQDMPRLPGPVRMTRTGDSPGQVVFRHETHVDASKPACTACHPREFRILKASGRRAPITHDGMDKGHYCGTCHDGKKAFARDDCAACHEG
jgi:c(7)-type cytochrome triheme protein